MSTRRAARHPTRDAIRIDRRATLLAGGLAAAPLLARTTRAGDAGTPASATPAGAPLDPDASIAAAIDFIGMAMDVGRDAGPRLARSYFGGPLGKDGFDPAFTFDNTLAIIALLAHAEPGGIARAEDLARGILAVQAGDPEGDGRIRDAYAPDPCSCRTTWPISPSTSAGAAHRWATWPGRRWPSATSPRRPTARTSATVPGSAPG